jgi:NAD(P)-dependent dehydrogenase (short-subunit alcohol dehydrogenase family)
LVSPGEFSGHHALVVGGSRGLGELVAKIVAAGGGISTITFAKGQTDAERVVSDIRTQGGTASAMPFDVLSARELEPPAIPFTHLYYFATPRIRPNAEKALDADLFRALFNYYGVGLIRTVEAAQAHSVRELVLCAPSTVFIDHPDSSFREYTAAKRAAEGVAQQLGGNGIRIYCPRMPRLRTDQTNALMDVGALDALQPMLDLVRAVR